MKAIRKNKFGNKKVTLNVKGVDVIFDSIAESERYQTLALLEKSGAITDLKLQPEFLLFHKFRRNGKAYRQEVYKADFQYTQDGKTIVEDVKGKKTELYMSKMKRFLFFYPDHVFVEWSKKNNKWTQKVY